MGRALGMSIADPPMLSALLTGLKQGIFGAISASFYSHWPVCVRHSSAGCIPNLDITVLRENDSDAMARRSKWPAAVCRSYSTAMAQQPKPAPSSQPKLKPNPLQRNKSTTDPDSIEEQLKALDQMRKMPSVYTTTDFWVLPMASLVRVYALAVDLP